MASTTDSFLAISNNLARQRAATACHPKVARETAHYLAAIGKATSIAEFVGNQRLFSYAMKAYGLEDMTYAKGLMTRILQGGVTDPSALATSLNDARYKAFATAFDFAGHGPRALQSSAATTQTTLKYVEQTLEDNAGRRNKGVELALYFQRNARSAANVQGLFVDTKLYQVLRTAFGPSASDEWNGEADTLGAHVAMADLQDPRQVRDIAERFTAMWDLDGNEPAPATASGPRLFARAAASTSPGLPGSTLGGM